MCPACFASAALLVAGVVSTGGASAVVAKILRNKRSVKNLEGSSIKKEKSS